MPIGMYPRVIGIAFLAPVMNFDVFEILIQLPNNPFLTEQVTYLIGCD